MRALLLLPLPHAARLADASISWIQEGKDRVAAALSLWHSAVGVPLRNSHPSMFLRLLLPFLFNFAATLRMGTG